MSDLTYYRPADLYLEEIPGASVEKGTMLLRVGLMDGSEHRIVMAPKGLRFVMREYGLEIRGDDGLYRTYRSWAWHEEIAQGAFYGLV